MNDVTEQLRKPSRRQQEAYSAVFDGPHWPYNGDGSKASRLAYLDATEEEIKLARAYVQKMA